MNPVVVRNIKIGEGIPKICVPIVGVTKEEIIKEAKTFDAIPVDVVEWRVDWFEHVFETDKAKVQSLPTISSFAGVLSKSWLEATTFTPC